MELAYVSQGCDWPNATKLGPLRKVVESEEAVVVRVGATWFGEEGARCRQQTTAGHSRRRARCTTTSIYGGGTARWSAFTMSLRELPRTGRGGRRAQRGDRGQPNRQDGANVWPAPSASSFRELIRAVCTNVSSLKGPRPASTSRRSTAPTPRWGRITTPRSCWPRRPHHKAKAEAAVLIVALWLW